MTSASTGRSDRRQWKDEPLVLFVEGYSDLAFYAEFLQHLGKHDRCFIQDLGGNGRTKLESEATLLLRPDNLKASSSKGIESAAVIVDADEDAAVAFRMAQGVLKKVVGVEIPNPGCWTPSPAGHTRFGIFIAGDAAGKGELETLAWQAWQGNPENHALRDCASSYLECAKKAGKSLRKPDKTRLGTVFAVLNDEDPRLGPAARTGLIDFKAGALAALRRFLEDM